MRRQKLDWKHEIDKKDLRYGVLMLLLYLAAIMIATAGCSRSPLVKADHAAGNPASMSEAKIAALGHPAAEAHAAVMSGRKLTIEKREQKHETSRHFDDDVYGVSFDFPKNYDLREGELGDMDRGLGYLGQIPMEFSTPRGVRLATVA